MTLLRLLIVCACACVLTGPSAVAATRPAGAVRVVVTTDVGAEVDDQWTLAHLALEKNIELVGVVTTHAPTLAYPPAKTAAKHAREVLAAVGRTEVPVVMGLEAAFGDEQDIKPGPGADFLLESSRGHSSERPLTILALGPATDIALALVVDPSFADRIEIVAMGFDAWPRGGDSWNVKNDPLAWKLLLQSRAPLVIGDTAISKRELTITRERARALAAGRGRAGAYLSKLFDGWLDKQSKHAQAVTGRADAWPIWDQVTTAWLLGHAQTADYPRPRLATDLTLVHPAAAAKAGPPIRWITEVDAEPVWAAFTSALDRRAAQER